MTLGRIIEMQRKYISKNNINMLTPPKWLVIFPLMMIIFCSVVLFFFVQEKKDSDKFMETAVPISAECTEVRRTLNTHENGPTYYYHADLQYEYNGMMYNLVNFSVNEDTKTGDFIKIYISPDNPNDARIPMTDKEYNFSFYGFIFMIIVGVVCMAALFVMRRKQKPRIDPWEIR